MPHLLWAAEENRRKLAHQLITELKQKGLTASVVSEPEEMLLALPQANLVLLDLALASSPLGDLVRRLKENPKTRDVPVMVLVSREVLAELEAADLFDDFVVEPFSAQELWLRIQRVLRAKGGPEEEEIVRANDLMLNLATYEVFVAGRLIDLTYKEYELLRFLLSHPGRVFSRETLLREVWGYDFYGGTRTVDVHIQRLRSKIEDSGHSFIETVRNVGYRFRGKAETRK